MRDLNSKFQVKFSEISLNNKKLLRAPGVGEILHE